MQLHSFQLYCVVDRYLQIVTSSIVRPDLHINIFLLFFFFFLFSKHSLNSFYIGSFLLPSSIIKISTGYHFTQPLSACITLKLNEHPQDMTRSSHQREMFNIYNRREGKNPSTSGTSTEENKKTVLKGWRVI